MYSSTNYSVRIDGKSEFITASEKEEFEERAAIMEYSGGLERQLAEREALYLILTRRKKLRNSA